MDRHDLVRWTLPAVFSGLPSTVHALASGADPLQGVRAAGTLLPRHRVRPSVAAGVVAHVAVSATWTAVLIAVDRRHRLGPIGGTVAGAIIAALDLELLGRRYPAIRSLPQPPQWLDHLCFGALTGAMLQCRPSQRR